VCRPCPTAALCALMSECYRQAPDLPASAADVLPGQGGAGSPCETHVESAWD